MLNISYCTWGAWCVYAVFAVQGVLGGKFKKKTKKKKQGHSHIWGVGIEYTASFSQFEKIMLRRAENLAGVLSFF